MRSISRIVARSCFATAAAAVLAATSALPAAAQYYYPPPVYYPAPPPPPVYYPNPYAVPQPYPVAPPPAYYTPAPRVSRNAVAEICSTQYGTCQIGPTRPGRGCNCFFTEAGKIRGVAIQR